MAASPSRGFWHRPFGGSLVGLSLFAVGIASLVFAASYYINPPVVRWIGIGIVFIVASQTIRPPYSRY